MYKKKTESDIMNEFFADIGTGKALSINKSGNTSVASKSQIVTDLEERKDIEAESEEVGLQILQEACTTGVVFGQERAITGTINFTKMQRD